MQQASRNLILLAFGIGVLATAPSHAEDKITTICSNGTTTTSCEVSLDDNVLKLKLNNGNSLSARRLGRWSEAERDGERVRSCNVRINLGDQIVYGLLRIDTKNGTWLIWPQRQIDIPELTHGSLDQT